MQTPTHLMNEKFNDRYFDVVNALDEAQQIYFDNNSLEERLAERKEAGEPFLIGETGFGVGRIVVALMEYLNKSSLKNLTIEYYSVELYPLSPEKMLLILDGFRDRVSDEIDALMAAYRSIDTSSHGWHSMFLKQPFGTIEIKLWIGEALEMVEALELPCDVWFLDGHGPKKNPSMWRRELLLAIGRKTVPGGTCSTYTIARTVRDSLVAAGFTLRRHPGHGGKKEVLQGLKL